MEITKKSDFTVDQVKGSKFKLFFNVLGVRSRKLICKMRIRFYTATALVKAISLIGKILNKNLSTLPGQIAYTVYPDILEILSKKCSKIILVTGTNGKTTTNNLIYGIMTSAGYNVLANLKGANLITGIISAFLNAQENHYDIGTFEVDEASFAKIVKYIQPNCIVVTNFSRDQLDRYGELEKTFEYINGALSTLDDAILVLNGDDPLVAKMGSSNNSKVIYYGIVQNDFSKSEGSVIESVFCPYCNGRLRYFYYNAGQSGRFLCEHCGFKNPDYDYFISNVSYGAFFKFTFNICGHAYNDIKFAYDGFYNLYNVCAALALANEVGVNMKTATEAVENFKYRLGRMERIVLGNKTVQLILVKNPVGYTEVLNSISNVAAAKVLLLVLNDNAADGRDVSWIWDVDFDILNHIQNIIKIYCSGRRYMDLAVRLKYSGFEMAKVEATSNVSYALDCALSEDVPIVYVLPTYTALFGVRDKILCINGEKQA
jgi:UDP-N-acetylmuramyl tripeptide synthase